MKEPTEQTLSALIDGACSGAERDAAIDRLLADEAQLRRWSRYHAIGRALRGEHSAVVADGVAPRLRAALAAAAETGPAADVVPFAARRRARPRVRTFVPVAGALAAGGLLLAVLTLPLMPGHSLDGGDTASAPALVGAGRATEDRWQSEDPLLQAKLDRFAVSHRATLGGPGLTGLLANAAFVGHETPR